MIRTCAVVLVALSLSTAPQQRTDASERERRDDTYAVYSTLLNDPVERGAYLIEAKTSSSMTIMMEFLLPRCVDVPWGYTAAWNEVLAEARTRKDSPGKIEAELKTNSPHVLLDETEVLALQNARAKGITPENPKLQSGGDLFTLGDVYFNQGRTLALTQLSVTTGSRLASTSTRWAVFEKGPDGKWTKLKWINCSYVTSY